MTMHTVFWHNGKHCKVNCLD